MHQTGIKKRRQIRRLAAMISVAEAQARLLGLITPSMAYETVPLMQAVGRTLAADVMAKRDHPPFAASAMDGYAVRFADVAQAPAQLTVTGSAIAGKRHLGPVKPGEAIRILTGAPMPADCDTVVLQEECLRRDDVLTVNTAPEHLGAHVRCAGLDVVGGTIIASKAALVTPRLAGLIAAGAVAAVVVHSRPSVMLLACGDELKLPGEALGEDDIVSSNSLVLAGMLRVVGTSVTGDDKVIGDDPAALEAAIRASSADVLISIGGASVGDRDYMQGALVAAGATIDFWRVALKPGKPMMVGKRGKQIIIGLPGNPVSAYVCAVLFAVPALKAMLGQNTFLPQTEKAVWGSDMRENGPRAEYVRVVIENGVATALKPQDSSMLSVLARADALAIRPPHAVAAAAGETVDIIWL